MARINRNGTISYTKITKPELVQANYLASMQDKYVVDDAINILTYLMLWNWFLPPITHTSGGVWLDDELWFFSSTSRKELGGKNGTRWIRASELLHNDKRWLLQVKYADTNTGPNSVRDCVRRANSMIGLGYDFPGIATDFAVPIRIWFKRRLASVIDKLKKIYCSKSVHAMWTGWVRVFSPKRQFRWARKNGFKTIDNTLRWCIQNDIL